MKALAISLSIACCIHLVACNPIKQADRKAQKNTIVDLYPQYPFDSAEAKRALTYGEVNITGVVYTKAKNDYGIRMGKPIYGNNLMITLFPVTPYFNEWYAMRKQKENKRTRVFMSDTAFHYRLTTQSDEYGRFKFEKMRPGKYFVQAILDWYLTKNYKDYVGGGTDGYYSVSYYQWKTYNENHSDRLEQFIEIKEGQKENVVLKLH